jgi:hypothetical protein
MIQEERKLVSEDKSYGEYDSHLQSQSSQGDEKLEVVLEASQFSRSRAGRDSPLDVEEPEVVALVGRRSRQLAVAPLAIRPLRRDVAMQVEGDSLLMGRHIHHPAFSLVARSFSQPDEEEVGQ